MTTPLRDYTKIEEENCQLVTHYGGNKFHCPRDVAIGPNDEAVIVDSAHTNEVIIFDKDLKLIRTFGQGSEDSELNYFIDVDELDDPADVAKLNYPGGVAVGHNVIAVSEWYNHVVKKFSLQGDYLSKFGSHGSGDGQFNNPQGLCFNSHGLLYVVDYSNCRVQVFRENVFLFKFGSKGHNPGQFQYPCYIAVDSSDQVYVTDCSKDGGISVFSEDGHFIKRINCIYPNAICIARDDHIIAAVQNDDNRITVFSPTHECIAKFGVFGRKKGTFCFITGIAINNSGTIFVTEGRSFGRGVSRLQIINI